MARVRPEQIKLDNGLTVTGSFNVLGGSVFIQSGSNPAIVVSGSQHVVPTNTYSGSIYIQGLGTFSDTGSNQVIDLGEY